jgi:hypothetical protein
LRTPWVCHSLTELTIIIGVNCVLNNRRHGRWIVVDEDRSVAGEHIVRVELIDGEVVHELAAGVRPGGGDDAVAVGGPQVVAGEEIVCLGPGVGGLVSEGVVGGGVQ